ncbi:hypothetical protein HZH66_007161 [Vespula vulgaris]|uniref:Uncharacterized protein n=1 Tax=Vespula vulgaris TaxID=7454 RepID=A0A834K0B6_VESVU|nr:hypothetical protein HZH66_007161 [Vespula vulgaris]
MAEKQILVLRLKAGVSIISTSTSTRITLPQPPTPPVGELERIGRSRDPRRRCGALNFAGGSPEADDGKYRRYSCRDADSRLERSTGHPISPSLSSLSLWNKIGKEKNGASRDKAGWTTLSIATECFPSSFKLPSPIMPKPEKKNMTPSEKKQQAWNAVCYLFPSQEAKQFESPATIRKSTTLS